MPKTTKSRTALAVTPAEVLQKYIDDYQTNPFALSKSLNVAYQSVTFILKGKAKISPKMALRLSAHYGNPVKYWIDLQTSAELTELSSDKKFQSILKKIPKAQKSKSNVKTSQKKPKAKNVKTKTAKTKTAKRKPANRQTGR